MRAREALIQATARLTDAGVPDPARDARRLLAHVLSRDAAAVTALGDALLPPDTATAFDAAIALRVQRKPVSQITGTRAFYGRDFFVDETVLDPRPETETLVEIALEKRFDRVLDLGTGSGAILVTLLAERPGASGVGTDISAGALQVAARNADRHGLGGRCILTASDWLADVGGPFDLIVSNPPYIASAEMPGLAPEVRDWEPRLALTDDGDGLGAYRAIVADVRGHLSPGGRLVVEIGPSQGTAVCAIMAGAGLGDIRVHRDLDGRDRVVSAAGH